MDNRFLYRGKKISTGEWAYGNIIENANGSMVIVNDFTGDIYMVDPATVSRCTGLFAAKSYRGESEMDKLIFEGDIVKLPRCQNDIATFEREINSLNYYLEGKNGRYELSGKGGSECFEIIGTIHDTMTEGEG